MKTKDAIIGIIAIVVIAGLVTGLITSLSGASAGDGPTVNEGATTTTPAPQETAKPPEAAKASAPGAKMLKESLGSDYRVFVREDGGVVVLFNSTAESGSELKDEIKSVALEYSGVLGEHPQTGPLTVTANGVRALVPKDTTIAHSEGRLKDSALFETIHYTSQKTTNDG